MPNERCMLGQRNREGEVVEGTFPLLVGGMNEVDYRQGQMKWAIDAEAIVDTKIKPIKRLLRKMCWKRSQYKRRKR